MDLSWPLPPGLSINGGTPRDYFFGAPKKMHLPSAGDYCELIRRAGRVCYLYAMDVARAYRQLQLDPADWPLVCFLFEGRYFVDISLPFGLRWAASHCQDITNLMAAELRRRGVTLLNYIDDFGGVAASGALARKHFSALQTLLADLGLQEATHKASPPPPAQRLTWLGFVFNTLDMTVTLPPAKLAEIMDLTQQWAVKCTANIRELRSLLGKLLHVAPCCPPARLFSTRMLETLRACPEQRRIALSPEFKKDVAWFNKFLPSVEGFFIIHEDDRVPVQLFVDACTSGCGAVTKMAAYHAQFPSHIVSEGHPICQLEALNAVVAIKLWAPSFSNCLLHLFSDNPTAVAIFHVGRGRDCFLQACAREIWLTCAVWDITLAVGHVLTGMADALSRYHLGQIYKDKVQLLLSDNNITCTRVPPSLFLSNDL